MGRRSEDYTGRSRLFLRLSAALTLFIFIAGIFFIQRFFARQARTELEKSLAATGVELDWLSLVPKTPPDADNFYASRIAKAWLPAKTTENGTPGNARVPLLPRGWFTSDLPTMKELSILPGKGSDIESLQRLGEWFDEFDDDFSEFRRAGSRPFVQIPGDYSSPEKVPIPNLVNVRTLAQVLATRARVHLLQRKSDLALLDLETLSVVMRSLESRPVSLLSEMNRSSVAEICIDVVKDGFRHRLWKPEDLISLKTRLEAMKLVSTFLKSIREGEMSGSCYLLGKFAEENHTSRKHLTQILCGNNQFMTEALALLPSDSVRKNQLILARLYVSWLNTFEADGSRFYPARNAAAANHTSSEFSRRRLENLLARSLIPGLDRVGVTCARRQIAVDQAVIVCALELYRLNYGAYPESLAQLSDPLPRDLITALPMCYHREGLDKFILYSAGINAVDERGKGDDWIW